MYCKEKQKSKKTHRNLPSFSSTLLDEICRSIDGNGESPENIETQREKSRSSRACLVEKWMENRGNVRIAAKKMENRDNDVVFFSSNSNSSDSSGALSSSDTEFFSSTKKSNSLKRPKPVRTSVSPHPNRDYLSPDDYQNEESNKSTDDPIKSKSTALKIYANLKKLKQPISPGMKLTNLINSFFSNMNRKKSKDGSRSKVHQEQSSSSASNNSCQNLMNEKRRTVRFVDQDSKPCGKKSTYADRCGRPPLPPMALRIEDRRKFDFSWKNRDEDEDEDEDDACSESSSDLFELDHLSLYGKSDRFCEELPVYKTTYIGKNRGLIR